MEWVLVPGIAHRVRTSGAVREPGDYGVHKGCRHSSTGRARTPLPGSPAGVISGRLSLSIVNQGANVWSAGDSDPL